MALAGLRSELLARISAELAAWPKAPVFAALFGSAARGNMRPESDIDMLVVRPHSVDIEDPHWRGQLDEVSARVTAWTGNDARVLELGEDETRRGLETGEPVLADIQAEGVVLYGSASYLSSQPRTRSARHG